MTDKKFLKALKGEVLKTPPIWLMRQAGRYLPEYMKVREQAGNFLNLCYNPARAAEVTLQPIRRFGFDAAILFSDILIVPDALGQEVRFETGEGPRLDPITDEAGFDRLNLDAVDEKYDSIAETVRLIKQDLPDEVALIGFCGAPWTVASYMVAGKGTPAQAPARHLAYTNPQLFEKIMATLVTSSIDYLSRQIEAGAEALQIFDSWAGSLPEGEFDRWVIKPTQDIIGCMKEKYPEIPIIGFPRGAGPLYEKYIAECAVDGVSCDSSLPVSWIRDHLQTKTTVQGNVDQLALVAGGKALENAVSHVLDGLCDGPFILNLGHGIVPETPPEHVAELIRLVRAREST